jgi:alpha/beta superfamily hydrolase
MGGSYVIDERMSFDVDGLALEGILSYRDDVGSGGKVLLLSPHPHFPGDMNNNVIRSAAAALAESGRIVLRFNYHGVEGSEPPALDGESIFDYWRRVEENRDYARSILDSAGAYRFLDEAPPRGKGGCFVVGYSFGSLVAVLAASRFPGLKGMALLSPPFGKIDLTRLEVPGCPVLLMIGEKDFVHDRDALGRAESRLGEAVRVELFPDSDHFFRGEEHRPVQKIIEYLGGLES